VALALRGGRLVGPLRILLGNRSLTWLVVAFAGLTIAEWAYVTALAVDAFRLHGAVAVGLVGFRLFFASVSSFCVSSFYKLRFVRRHPSAWVLSAIAGTRAAIVAASSILAATGAPLAPLLVLVALDAIVSGPYRPTQSSLLPALARTPRELAASAAGISTVKTLSQAVGAIAGGFLLVVTTPATVFAGAAALLLGTALATVRFSHVPIGVADVNARGATRGVAHDMLDVIGQPYVGGILVVSGLRTFVRGMWIAIAVIASLRLLHAGSAGVGLLMLAAGIGALAAVPLSAALIDRSRLGAPAALAFIACGIPLVVMAGVPEFDVALLLVVAWGVGMAVADVATLSFLHRLLDTPLLPRVTGAIESAKLALEGLGALLAPVLAVTLGIRWALVAAGLPLPVVVVAGRKLLHRLDATAGERSGLLSMLHEVPFLEPLDLVALESLAGRMIEVTVGEGTDVVRQGDKGDRFYVVKSGIADVLVDGFRVGSVAAGGHFGERALLRDAPRMATVRSRGQMELLALPREDFLTVLTDQTAAAARSGDAVSVPSHSRWTQREVARLLSRVSLLAHLDSSALRRLAERSVIDNWPTGGRIIRRGEEGDRFYVLLDGRAVVSSGAGVVSELHPGDQFGEIALLHNVPRRADVTASTPAVTLSLHRDDFLPAVRSQMLLG
jgi:CRP-like cAMP-binding protein